jgi:hypothetical protein
MEAEQFKKSLDNEVRRFAGRLRKSYPAEIEADPGFRAKVIGKLRGLLPHRRPGRKGSPEIKLYLNLYSAKGLPGNWHELAKRLVSALPACQLRCRGTIASGFDLRPSLIFTISDRG